MMMTETPTAPTKPSKLYHIVSTVILPTIGVWFIYVGLGELPAQLYAFALVMAGLSGLLYNQKS